MSHDQRPAMSGNERLAVSRDEQLDYERLAVSRDEQLDDERLQPALELALAFLNRRDRSVQELRLHLERKGVSAELTDACVQILRQAGYLDDTRFALLFVQDKRELEGWGSERIERGLAARGIERGLIHSALSRDELERAAGETELDRALAVLRRRFPSPPHERRDRDRALGVLIRKGFESELALDALAAYARPG